MEVEVSSPISRTDMANCNPMKGEALGVAVGVWERPNGAFFPKTPLNSLGEDEVDLLLLWSSRKPGISVRAIAKATCAMGCTNLVGWRSKAIGTQ